MDDRAIDRQIAVGKVEQAFGLFIDRFASLDPSRSRGDVARLASDFFAGMIAGVLLDPAAPPNDVAEKAVGAISLVAVANISRDERFIKEMVSKVAEIRG